MPYPDFQGVEGEGLTLAFEVSNDGSVEGSEDIDLNIEGLINTSFSGTNPVAQTEVTLGASETTTETLTWSVDSSEGIGYYKATVDSGEYEDNLKVIAEVCFDDRVYLPGGTNDRDVLRRMSSDGNSFTDSDASSTDNLPNLAIPVHQSASVMYDGHLYVVGGYDDNDTGVSKHVQQWDGSSSSFTTDEDTGGPPSLASRRKQHRTVVFDGYLYVITGDGGSAAYDPSVIQRWDGDDSNSFVASSNGSFPSLAEDAEHPAVTVYDGYIYVFGGSTSESNTVQRWDGESSTWETSGSNSDIPALNTKLQHATATVFNDNIYILGGFDGSNNLNEVQRWDGTASGTFESASNTSGLPTLNTGVSSHASTVYNGYLYVFGGLTGSGNTTDEVQRWDGSSQDTFDSHTPLPSAEDGFKAVTLTQP